MSTKSELCAKVGIRCMFHLTWDPSFHLCFRELRVIAGEHCMYCQASYASSILGLVVLAIAFSCVTANLVLNTQSLSFISLFIHHFCIPAFLRSGWCVLEYPVFYPHFNFEWYVKLREAETQLSGYWFGFHQPVQNRLALAVGTCLYEEDLYFSFLVLEEQQKSSFWKDKVTLGHL